MAFRRQLVPLLVAATTGVVSGIYIFKPLVTPQPELEKAPVFAVKEPLNLAKDIRASEVHDAEKSS